MNVRKIILCICFLIMGTVFAAEIHACACVNDSPSRSVKVTDAVFIGEVRKALVPRREWSVSVTSVIKGDVKRSVTVFAAMVGTSCETSSFQTGLTYVFFTSKIKEKDLRNADTGEIRSEDLEKIGNFEPVVCGWTALLSDWDTEWFRQRLKEDDDEAFLKLLKKGRRPKE